MKPRILLLCLFLMLPILAGCSSGGADWTEIALARPDPNSDGTMDLNGLTVAVSVNAPFGGIELNCRAESAENTVTAAIYRADRNYETSLSADPVRTCTVRNVGKSFLWKFRTLPEGDYLILFSEAEHIEAERSVVPSEAANGKILQYRGGAVVTEGICKMTLLLATKDEESFAYLGLFAYPVPESDPS